jgi:hypothetical protein
MPACVRTPAARAGIAVAALAAVIALFIALAGDDEGGTESGTTLAQSAQGPTGDQSPEPQPPKRVRP